MTRDEAREKFAAAGLTYADLTKDRVKRLAAIINTKMVASGLIKDTYRCPQRVTWRDGKEGRFFAGIKCNSFYFSGREAVSFNRDGFIGFAGWADRENVQPILDGFSEWVDELSLCVSGGSAKHRDSVRWAKRLNWCLVRQ